MVIGLLGGMGTYATINIFKQYAALFKAKKEWERPRIIIDNRCTMPSRVRALMYGENKDVVIKEISDSLIHLSNMGCDKIIVGCNTAHLFVPYVLERYPLLKDKFRSIIDLCCERVKADGVDEVFLVASEGTIDSGIYQQKLQNFNIKCTVPSTEDYYKLRQCIESVKQNVFSDETADIFINMINNHENCILGCTEFPILYQMYKDSINCKKIYDPIYITLESIKGEV